MIRKLFVGSLLIIISVGVNAQKELRRIDSTISIEYLLSEKYWKLRGNSFDSLEYLGSIEYDLSKYLLEKQSVNVKITHLINKEYSNKSEEDFTYETREIIGDLEYYNINRLRFESRDSIVEFINILEPHMEIYVQFDTSMQFLGVLDRFNKVEHLTEFDNVFKEISKVNRQKENTICKDLEKYNLNSLIDNFYGKFYRENTDCKYTVIPQKITVELGSIDISHLGEDYFKNFDDQIIGEIYFSCSPFATFNIDYSTKINNPNNLFLDEKLRIALELYLGYDFSYHLDSVTNTPSEIKPINYTNKRFNTIKEFIDLQYSYVIHDYCNVYMFWDFCWILNAPFTTNKISIDEQSGKAAIYYHNEDLEEYVAIYQLNGNDWEFKEVLKPGFIYKQSFSIYFIVALVLFLLIATYIIIKTRRNWSFKKK